MFKTKYLFSGIILAFLLSISIAPTIESQTLTPITNDGYFTSYPTLTGLDAKITALEGRVLTNEYRIDEEVYLEWAFEMLDKWQGTLNISNVLDVRDGTITIPEFVQLGIDHNQEAYDAVIDNDPTRAQIYLDNVNALQDFQSTIPAWLW